MPEPQMKQFLFYYKTYIEYPFAIAALFSSKYEI